MGAVDDLKKARDSWQNQKDQNLTDARICDTSIKVLDSAIQIVEAYAAKEETPKEEPTEE